MLQEEIITPDMQNTKNINQTCVRLTPEDWEYCKKYHLKFSEILRKAITLDRDIRFGVTESNIEREKELKEKFKTKFQKTLDFIQEKNPQILEECLDKINHG